MNKLIISRRLSQYLFLGVFIYIIWSSTFPLYRPFLPVLLYKLDPLVIFLTSLIKRCLISGWIISAVIIFLTLILGRFFCGWICPLGTIQDCVNVIRRSKKSSPGPISAIKIKFFVLGLLALLSVFAINLLWAFDPIVISARFIALNFIPTVVFVINWLFVGLIKLFSLYGSVYDLYLFLKSNILGVKAVFFSNAGVIFLSFFILILPAYFISRFWCRILCPLGALLSIFGSFSLLRRDIRECVSCKECSSYCRMGAIKKDATYIKGECILCMDCIYNCPHKKTRFVLGYGLGVKSSHCPNGGLTRRDFLVFTIFSFMAQLRTTQNKKSRAVAEFLKRTDLIRPPGAHREDIFIDICIRCANCIRVCPTNVLQPTMFQAGLEAIWTPAMVYEIGYCEYNCNLCGKVCPTGAIPLLDIASKQRVRLGLAKVNRQICMAWAQNKECIVCEEHCPIPKKAIKLIVPKDTEKKVLRPLVEPSLCIGCGICQYKCPMRPIRAIIVYPIKKT